MHLFAGWDKVHWNSPCSYSLGVYIRIYIYCISMYNIYNARRSQKHTRHYSPLVASFGTLHCTVPCSPPTYRVATRITRWNTKKKAELLSRAPQSAQQIFKILWLVVLTILEKYESMGRISLVLWKKKLFETTSQLKVSSRDHGNPWRPENKKDSLDQRWYENQELSFTHSCQEKCSHLAFCIRLELLDCNLCGRLLCRLLPWLRVSLEISA